MKGGPI